MRKISPSCWNSLKYLLLEADFTIMPTLLFVDTPATTWRLLRVTRGPAVTFLAALGCVGAMAAIRLLHPGLVLRVVSWVRRKVKACGPLLRQDDAA